MVDRTTKEWQFQRDLADKLAKQIDLATSDPAQQRLMVKEIQDNLLDLIKQIDVEQYPDYYRNNVRTHKSGAVVKLSDKVELIDTPLIATHLLGLNSCFSFL